MAQKLVKLGIKRQKGYLYYVDKDGDVSCAKMARGKKKGGNPKKIAKCGIKRKEGYLYFVDKDGDVSCAKMKRGKK
ncbi:MAG: hypothetical protein NC928_00935 [Candidatus Omnitrophica bacterium]|nr:hypothetical protein [Candidatus Omnitrophota bacterium]